MILVRLASVCVRDASPFLSASNKVVIDGGRSDEQFSGNDIFKGTNGRDFAESQPDFKMRRIPRIENRSSALLSRTKERLQNQRVPVTASQAVCNRKRA